MVDQPSNPQFGTNSWIVDEMYRDYIADPESVAESWRDFFSDYRPASGFGAMAAGGNGAGAAAPPRPAPPRPAAPPEPPSGQPAAAAPAQQRRPAPERPSSAGSAQPDAATSDGAPEGAEPLRGVAAVIAKNMNDSRSMPTATSIRVIPAKLLEVNRKIVNNQLQRTRGGKVSFTHLIGWAIVKALGELPVMTSSYHEADGKALVRRPEHVNLGLAVDVERKDGSRTLLVPNIKAADTLDFAAFFGAYEEIVRRIKASKLDPELFADTTVTLTNPGTVGTVGSVPRLMPGQSAIIGVGAIDYPAEYQGADPRTLAQLAVGKVVTVTSTYDHRVIQGAESGLFLQTMHRLLLGELDFYDEIFDSLQLPYEPVRWHRDEHIAGAPPGSAAHADKQVAVGRLVNAYRVRGHLIAAINPLSHTFQRVHPELDPATYGLTIWDLDREYATGGLAGRTRMALGDILGLLRDAYCRTVGVEYMHISEREEKAWIQDKVEGVKTTLSVEDQKHLLGQLNNAEVFEKFLHTKYIGHKRFSLEGAESLIPMLDALLNSAADDGLRGAVIGMAHRGRLNVLANILGKSYDKIFREFEGDVDPDSVQGSGDVKYHLGARGSHTSPAGTTIPLTLSSNPSHLEAVDPVVEGMVRAEIDKLRQAGEIPADDFLAVLPILVHGDAAFAGQGVVAETLSMSQLRGYRTGGTVHVVVNNQVGFTTGPQQARSSTYATDVAKMVQAPIWHVNGDDPEACVRVMRLALAFRQRFGKDVVVDMLCYRRWGHNEGDDPSYTQPIMYAAIENRRSVRKLYTEELVNRGDLTVEEAEQALDGFRLRPGGRAQGNPRDDAPVQGAGGPSTQAQRGAAVGGHRRRARGPGHDLRGGRLGPGRLHHPPQARQAVGEAPHPAGDRHRGLGDGRGRWRSAACCARAFPSAWRVRTPGGARSASATVCSSTTTRALSGRPGQPRAGLRCDGGRRLGRGGRPGGLRQVHGLRLAAERVRRDGLRVRLLGGPQGRARAVEGQFGDFVNGAQVVIDQFLVAAEDKWGQTSGLVLLLPHGYEGQGPEHSSARKERFLVLAAEDNIQVAEPTTAAQYFHLLRRQMLRDVRKPLIVFTPSGAAARQAGGVRGR